MKTLRFNFLLTILLLAVASVTGCSRSNPPPTPLTMEELPGVVEKAFSTANPELKGLATGILAAFQAKDYAKAFMGIQNLLGKPDLNPEQTTALTRASMTVSDLVQTAQSQGDAKATQVLKYHMENK